MKRNEIIIWLIVFVLGIVPQLVMAETVTFGQFFAAKVREMKVVYSLTWEAKKARHAGGAYVPINTLTSKDGNFEYLDWGLGAEEPEGSAKPRLIIPIMANIVDISRKVFNFRWARDHIRTTALPPIWIGPIWYPPSRLSKQGLNDYIFLHNLGVGLSARFGALLPEAKK